MASRQLKVRGTKGFTKIVSLDDKQRELRDRQQHVKSLSSAVDSALATASGTPGGIAGCLAGLRRAMRRAYASASGNASTAESATPCLSASAASSTSADAAANGSSSSSSSSSSKVGGNKMQRASRLFGVSKADPQAKLQTATQALQSRVMELESRAEHQRAEAKRLMVNQSKPAALRMLKKAKATEKQVEANHATLAALESQLDLVEQATMQKQIASALMVSSKTMKSQKGIVSMAENAVDEAAEVRDMADDLTSALSEMGSSTPAEDDDELLAELEEMMAEPQHEAPGQAKAAETKEERKAREAEIAMLEAKIARHEEQKRLKAQFPSAPTDNVEEEKEEEKEGKVEVEAVGVAVASAT